MPGRTDCRYKLKDERTLGYAGYGHPRGMSVSHFHATPRSWFKLFDPAFDKITAPLHIPLTLSECPGANESIPNCRANFYPQDVHLSLIVPHYEGACSDIVVGGCRDRGN